MIIKIQPDKQKAKSLGGMAKVTLKRLKEIKKEKYPSNTLTDYYDIIRKLMDALNSLEGIKIKGEGAHSQIINYVCNKYELGSSIKYFLQEMRDYRNRISYEGFSVRENYIKVNTKRIEMIINLLLKIMGDKF
jgi:hypothetical protein